MEHATAVRGVVAQDGAIRGSWSGQLILLSGDVTEAAEEWIRIGPTRRRQAANIAVLVAGMT